MAAVLIDKFLVLKVFSKEKHWKSFNRWHRNTKWLFQKL